MKLEPSRLRLYAVTDRSWLNGGRLVDAVAAALDGGATFVQLREKALDPADLLAEARQLAALCHARQVPFVVDDNVDIALAAQADGADYLGCGAAFVTGTKLDTHPVSAETMRAVTAAVDIPVVAIGGISAANISQLNGRGLAGVAVISGIFAKPDITAAARELYRLAGEL